MRSMNRISSFVLVLTILLANLFIFTPIIPSANALKIWTQTSITDFMKGTLDNLTIPKSSGTDADLVLAIGERNLWLHKNLDVKPSARENHAMATIYNDDKVVLFGEDETWIYDLSDNKWENKTPTTKPSAREKHAMATIYNDDKVVLFGGYDGNYDNETWVYDLSDNTWTNKLPTTKPSARDSHAMATVYNDDKVVLFGGEYFIGNYDDETWVYDLSDNKWINKNPIPRPFPRENHAMAGIYNDDKVVLFGGSSGGDETWIYALTAYNSSGTYISSELDTGGNSSFKKIYWNGSVPENTSIKFQVRTADIQSNLSSKNFVGPDGTANTYYTTSGSNISLYHNGNRWLQYKANLSTVNPLKTPVLNDVTITYNLIPFPPTLTSPANAQWLNNSKPTFSWKFNDLDNGTQSEFIVQIDNNISFESVDYTSGEISSSTSSWTPSNPISDGIWCWRVKTKDKDNDWSSYSDVWIVKIDTTAPLTDHSISGKIGENGWYNSNVQVMLSSSDLTSGVAETKYKVDDDNWSIYKNAFLISDEGEHIVNYYSKDNAGNEEVNRSITIKIDTKAPYLNIDEPMIGTLTNKDEIYINGTTEPDAKIKINGLEVEVRESNFSHKIVLIEGDNAIQISAYDKAGNINKTERKIILDITPPKIIEVKFPDVALLTEQICITNKKTAYIEVYIDSDNACSVVVNFDELFIIELKYELNKWVGKMENLTPGIHNISIKAIDRAGNFDMETRKIIVDIDPPQIIDSIPSNNSKVKEQEINLRIKVKDNVDIKKIEIEEYSTVFKCEKIGNEELKIDKNISLKIGENILYVNVEDCAGNVNSTQIILYYEPLFVHKPFPKPFSAPTFIPYIPLFAALLIIIFSSIAYVIYRKRLSKPSLKVVKKPKKIIKPHREPIILTKKEEKTELEEAFLVYYGGQLISRVGIKEEEIDSLSFAGMLSAVQSFIKESFSDPKGSLHAISYGKKKIVIERGQQMFLAVIFTGNEPETLRRNMRQALIKIWDTYKEVLKRWDGTLDNLPGIENIIKSEIFK